MSSHDTGEPANRLWGGRFGEATDAFVQRFTASVAFDRRLYLHDIRGSIAHARMLCKAGVLGEAERDRIVAGLEQVRSEIDAGTFAWSVALEDVHMNVEARLTEIVGEVGKKLHTARSRNDQVATDVRLWLRDAIDGIDLALTRLLGVLVDLGEREAATIMPGFTHLQSAQPVTFGHHMLAWHEMAARDRERLRDCRRRLNRSPLGAGALAGTTFPIDRAHTAAALGFDAPCENSLDAVADRDFAIEFAAFASLLMVHLSRWSEELVLWTSAQFQFVRLPDRFCTGSSIMPQKKNPDVPELVRGKTGRVIGSLNALLVLMKGQPLAYNKDNQEDKEPLFDCADTVRDCVEAYARMLAALEPNRDTLRDAAIRGCATATDLADHLVRGGMPFRDAHEVVGRAVRLALERGRDLSQLTLAELRGVHAGFDEAALAALSLDASVAARNHLGGTAPAQVRAAAARARERL
jgi:argininosuccinate lyase